MGILKTKKNLIIVISAIIAAALLCVLIIGICNCTNDSNDESKNSASNSSNSPHVHLYDKKGICSCGTTRQIEVKLYVDGHYEQSFYTDASCNYKITEPEKPEDISTNPNSERYFYGWFTDYNF